MSIYLVKIVILILTEGFGFNDNQTIHAVDTVNGYKVSDDN